MISLIIDTCTEKGLIAFVSCVHPQMDLLFLSELPEGLHSSRFLLPKLEEAFQAIGKRPEEIGRIVVASGPGSYTGVRAGVVAAKTLSYVCRIPLIGVSSLESLIPREEGEFAALIDAKMSGCYLLRGKREKERVVNIGLPQLASLEQVGKAVESVEWVVSPDSVVLQERLSFIDSERGWKWVERSADPIHMARLGEEKFLRGEYSTDGSLEILYLR